MNFMIEIRHIESGLAKVFHTVEELAAHLADNVKEEWEGWTHLRLHPALAALDEPKMEAAPAPAEPPAPAPTAAPAEPPADAVAHDPAQDTTGS